MKLSPNILLIPMLLSTAVTVSSAEPAKTPAETTTYFANDPVKWASPEVVLPPIYPQAALTKRVTAVVDATLNLKATGRLDSIVEMQSTPKDVSFEAAVEEVLKHWRFAQSLDESCRPIPAQSRVRVWFEVKDDKPSISVTHVPASGAPGAAGIKAINRPELADLLSAATPRDARYHGMGADVYARLTVDPRTGVPRSVDIVTIAGSPRLFDKSSGSALSTNRPPSIAIQYGIATRNALMQARFEAMKDASESTIGVCFQVSFKISDDGK